MGFSGIAYGWGQKGNPPKSMSHISYNGETWRSYTLSKEDHDSWHTIWILVTLAFFHLKSAIFVSSKNTDIDCILVHNFSFFFLKLFRVFKGCFNKSGCNFDDVKKIGYSKLSENKGILKWGLWRHNFCSWLYQQNFIPLLKLYCRCDHLTEVWWL